MGRRFDKTGRALLGIWVLVMTLVGATLLARHVIAMPHPAANDPALARAMSTLRSPGDEGRWMAVHVLYAECTCSKRIADHLLASARPADLSEKVLLVGHSDTLHDRLAARGFSVTSVSIEDLGSRFHVGAAPLFILVAPDGSVRYSGGYTTTKQGPDPRDLDIVAAARADRTIDTLPVLGCAVSDKLRAALNPMGLP